MCSGPEPAKPTGGEFHPIVKNVKRLLISEIFLSTSSPMKPDGAKAESKDSPVPYI